MRLSDAQIDRYSRQIILREVGGTGQVRLLGARCIALGGGPALEVAVSYLAGAGVGAIDLVPASAAPAAHAALPFAPAGSRSPDSAVTILPPSWQGSLDDYDLALLFAGPGTSLAAVLPAGRARVGSFVLRAQRGGDLELTCLPRDTGCLACLAPAPSALAGPQPDDLVRAAGAGALLALACCRWLLDGARDERARTLRLAAAGAVWSEQDARRITCPRGCPPPAQPL